MAHNEEELRIVRVGKITPKRHGLNVGYHVFRLGSQRVDLFLVPTTEALPYN